MFNPLEPASPHQLLQSQDDDDMDHHAVEMQSVLSNGNSISKSLKKHEKRRSSLFGNHAPSKDAILQSHKPASDSWVQSIEYSLIAPNFIGNLLLCALILFRQ